MVRLKEQQLITLSYITIQKDYIPESDIVFQINLSLFNLSTKLDKFREQKWFKAATCGFVPILFTLISSLFTISVYRFDKAIEIIFLITLVLVILLNEIISSLLPFQGGKREVSILPGGFSLSPAESKMRPPLVRKILD